MGWGPTSSHMLLSLSACMYGSTPLSYCVRWVRLAVSIVWTLWQGWACGWLCPQSGRSYFALCAVLGVVVHNHTRRLWFALCSDLWPIKRHFGFLGMGLSGLFGNHTGAIVCAAGFALGSRATHAAAVPVGLAVGLGGHAGGLVYVQEALAQKTKTLTSGQAPSASVGFASC